MYLTISLHSILALVVLICLIGCIFGYSPQGQNWPRYVPVSFGGLVTLLIILFLLRVI